MRYAGQGSRVLGQMERNTGHPALGQSDIGVEYPSTGVPAIQMSASPIGEGVASGNLTLTARLNASPVGEGVVERAVFRRVQFLAASPVGEGVVDTARLRAFKKMSASPIGEGVLNVERPRITRALIASPKGEGVVNTANLKATFRISASPLGEGTVDANLKATFRLSASPTGEGVVNSANMRLIKRLIATAIGEGVASGNLTKTVRLAASPIGEGVVVRAEIFEEAGPLKGKAGFFWSPTAGTTNTFDMAWPLQLEPGGIEAAQSKWREVAEPLDKTATREVYVVEPPTGRIDTVTATVRFERKPDDLLRLMEHMADGGQADYTTDVNSTSANRRTVELVGIEDVSRIRPDSDREADKEFEADLKLRATTDGAFDDLI